MCQGNTAAGGSRVLWARPKFGIKISKGLIGWMLKFMTKHVICSGWNLNTVKDSNI